MFSFRAYFFGNEVYINERYKYNSNEILTRFLCSNNYKEVDEIDWVQRLKFYKKKLQISKDMDYQNYLDYNKNVKSVSNIFSGIYEYILTLPPYDKIINTESITIESFLNHHSFLFEDGLEEDQEVTLDTANEYGYGDMEGDNCYFKLYKFKPIDIDGFDIFDDDENAYLTEFNEKLSNFFDEYISLVESYLSVYMIFAPFIDNYLHRKETFLSSDEIAMMYDEFNNSHAKHFRQLKCKMNSFSYKSLVNASGENILCDEILFEDLGSFLYYDLFYGIKINYIPNKCKNCGRYFLIKSGKYLNFCDRKAKGENGKTCHDVGSKRRYDDKCKNDPIWQTYNRAYKAHYARYMKKKMTISEFEEWSRFAVKIRDNAISGKISYDEYYTSIRK